MSKNIAVIGPGTCKPSSGIYKSAVKVGELLANENATIFSGGYGGIMEAVFKGADRKDGANTIAFTHGEPGANDFAVQEVRGIDYLKTEKAIKKEGLPLVDHLDLSVRLGCITGADGIIVFPGGIGTFVELMAALVRFRYFGSKRISILLPPNAERLNRTFWGHRLFEMLKRDLGYNCDFSSFVKITDSHEEAVRWVLGLV